MSEVDFLILGSGYTGEILEKALQKVSPFAGISKTRRSDSQFIQFDLSKRETWKNLPKAKCVFWMFAAEDPVSTKEFIQNEFSKFRKVIVTSSTGFFESLDDAIVTEDSPLITELPRVQSEELLREAGAIVVHAAGIYGPDRSPLNWYRRGLIKNVYKWLNLIHVEDLAQILIRASDQAKSGHRFIASDSHPILWFDILKRWVKSADEIQNGFDSSKARIGKRIDNSKSLSALSISLKYPDIHAGLRSLEARQS